MSQKYGIPVSPQKPGETPIYRKPEVTKELLQFTFQNVLTMQDYFLYRVKKYPHHNLIGQRDPSKSNQYVFKTSTQVYEIAKTLGSAIISNGMTKPIKEYKNYELKLIGLYSKNREEWALCDFASMLYGLSTVPLYDTLSPKAIEYILNQTNVETMFCSKEGAATFTKEINLGKVKNIVCFDEIDAPIKEALLKKGLKLYNFYSLISEQKGNILEFPKNISPKDLYTLMFTSGTTGVPKGVITTHEMMIASFISDASMGIDIEPTFKWLSYLPFGHIYERTCFHWHSLHGASIGFYSGDPAKLLDDIKELKPSILGSVPRLFNRFYDKLKVLKDDPELTQKARAMFGGEVKLVLSASAPIAISVLQFFKKALGVNVVEAYGQSEATGIITVTSNHDLDGSGIGTLGGPSTTQEIKLLDIPEMNYSSVNVENGILMPKGEILARGYNITPGYQKDEEKTKETIDNDGWLHTGDVAVKSIFQITIYQVLLPNGALRLIDRKKHLFKLSNAEFVAPERLELIYLRCPVIEEMFIHGDSLESQLVAIVLPRKEWVMKKAIELKIDEKIPFEDLIKKLEINKALLEELSIHAKKEDLLRFEVIKKIHLVTQSFQTFDLLTTTFKIKRHQAKEHFKVELKNLYKDPIPSVEKLD